MDASLLALAKSLYHVKRFLPLSFLCFESLTVVQEAKIIVRVLAANVTYFIQHIVE